MFHQILPVLLLLGATIYAPPARADHVFNPVDAPAERPRGSTTVSCDGNWECAPTTPENLQVDAISCTELIASWSPSEPNNGSDVAGYTLWQNLPDFEPTVVLHPTTEVLLDATPSTEYVFEITAFDSHNNFSAHSEWAFATTPPCDGVTTTTLPSCKGNFACAPTIPGNVQAEAISCSEVLVTWDESEPQGGSDVRNYLVIQVRVDPEGGEYDFTVTNTAYPATSAIVAALPGVEYYYYMNAGDSNNNYSPYSGDWPFVTPPPCDSTCQELYLHHVGCEIPVKISGLPNNTKVPLDGCYAHISHTAEEAW
jgi:hypothetical protein